eukprot:gene7381-516_t
MPISKVGKVCAALALGAVSIGVQLWRKPAHAETGTHTPHLPVFPYGIPDMGSLKHRPYHVVSYNQALRIPNWVCETIDTRTVEPGKADRTQCPFRGDPSIPPFFQSLDSDYRGSGYDRGHLAAAANHRTNIAPQVGQGFNRDAWNQLEGYVRRLTKAYVHVHVCSGPLFLPVTRPGGHKIVTFEVIGKNNVAVPTHFFKVVAGMRSDGGVEIQSFILPNQPIPTGQPLINYLVSLEDVEKAAGVLFFQGLTDKYSRTLRRNGKLSGRFDKRDKT